METLTQFRVFHEVPWGIEIVLYFFFIGISVGAYFISILPSVFGRKQYENLSKMSWIVSFILLAVCNVILIFDLEQPMRFINLLNPAYLHLSTAPLAWGTLILLGYGLFVVLYAWGLFTEDEGKAKTFGAIGGIFALAIPVYTGFDLAINQRMPMAHSGLVPVMFVALALSSGVGVVTILAYIRGLLGGEELGEDQISGLRNILLWSVGAVFVMTIAQSVTLVNGGAYEETTFWIIAKQMGGMYWWLGFILGTIVPLIILLLPQIGGTVGGMAVASILMVIASYAYRYVIIYASQIVQLYLT